MTLKEGKDRVYMLLDEYGDGSEIDEDIEAKLPAFFDMAQKEVAKTKPLPTLFTVERAAGQTAYPMPADFLKLRAVWSDGRERTGRYRWRMGQLMIPESDRSLVEVEYNRLPAAITPETPDDYVFELEEDAAQCMPYFVAANCLVSDLVQDFSPLLSIYQMMLQGLDTGAPGERVRLTQSFYRR